MRSKKKITENKDKLTFPKFKARLLFKTKEFLDILPYHFLVMGSVFIVATIFNKYIEAVCFLTAFFSLRYKFDKTYHSNNIVICMTMTISMFSLSIVFCLPIYTSIFSSIFFAYVDCYILWFLRDRKDAKKAMLLYEKRLDEALAKIEKLENIDLYKMTEDELRQYGASKMLSEVQQDILVMRVIEHLKIIEICRYRNYGRTTIKYHISEIKRKLGIDQV